jgi:hypothetical protein
MKTSIRHLLAPLACAAALCLALPSQAATVTGSATSANVLQGGSATVTVTLDLSDAVDLLGLTLSASWATGALSTDISSVQVFGGSLASFTALFMPDFTIADGDDHHLGISVLTLPPSPVGLPAGPSTISFSITGLALGSHEVQYSLSLTDDAFNDVASADFSSNVTVSAVPEPGPAALLAAGIAVLGLLARRKLV